MNISMRQLKSGSWQIRHQINGKRYEVTVAYKPTQKEAWQLLTEKMKTPPSKHVRMTFSMYAMEMINRQENVLSVGTVREYERNIHRLPDWFTAKFIFDITQKDIQTVINELAKRLAPKTVKDYHAFISKVMRDYNPELRLTTVLPQQRTKEPNIPIEKELKQLLEYTLINAPHFYVPICLGCFSLRRSEIMALQYPDDLDVENCIVHVNKALVQDRNKEWVIKSNKTDKSRRDVPIPKDLVDIIQAQGYFYNGAPNSISNYMKRTEEKLGLSAFSLHKNRHFFASKLFDMGIDSKTIQDLGGWKGSETLTKVYQHSLALKDAERKQKLAEELRKSII